MAVVDQENEGKKENSKESLITNFNNPLFVFSYVIASTLYYSYV
jgi:hypothetical protein